MSSTLTEPAPVQLLATPAQAVLPPPPAATARPRPASHSATSAERTVSRETGVDLDDRHLSKGERWSVMAREVACHIATYVAGWADASSGPLIPYIQTHYGISYTIFIGQTIGYLTSALLNHVLVTRFGLGKVITVGAALQCIAYSLLIPAFPFPVMPVLYVFAGLGVSLQMANANVYIAGLPKAEQKLSYAHGTYGIGAAVCPLAATAFVSANILFARFYAVSFGLAVVSLTFMLYAFKFSYILDTSPPSTTGAAVVEVTRRASNESNPSTELENLDTSRRASVASAAEDKLATSMQLGGLEGAPAVATLDTVSGVGKKESKLAQSWKEGAYYQAIVRRATLVMSLFIFQYVGSEVAMGGWIVSFLQDKRNGGPDAGYVASGYWFGLVVGRLGLIPVTRLIGERWSVMIYTGAAAALEFVIWFRHDFIGNAVTVALIGCMMGPSYPIAVSVLTKLLPRHLHSPAIAFIAACGSVGGAVFPFITGSLAQRFSPSVLQPVMVILLVGQVAMWACLPKVERKVE
ncbi:hypothetical protein JCM11251_000564 [Rhodosporidiobolus azoricus]